MKKLNSFCCKVLLVILLLSSCETESPISLKPGKINFSWKAGKQQGGRIQNTAPKAILVTIKRADGTFAEQQKKLTLYTFGSEFVSETLELSPGEYTLEEFFVLDEDDNILYATPTSQSELAQHVDHPLPVDFTVSEAGITQLIVQVLAVEEGDTPEVFGYVSFGFEIVEKPTTQSRLKELWIDEESGAKHKVFFIYSGELLVQTEIYSLWGAAWGETNWTLNGKTYFEYDDQGRLINKTIEDSNSQESDMVFTYEYIADQLTRITRNGGGGFASVDITFSYNAEGKISSAIQPGFVPADYEYEVNALGDVIKQRRYIGIPPDRRLQYEIEFEYHPSLRNPSIALEGLFDFDIFLLGTTFSKHNISAHKTTAYHKESIDGPPVVTFSCTNTMQYQQNITGLITTATYFDPNFCVTHAYENNNLFTFIYE